MDAELAGVIKTLIWCLMCGGVVGAICWATVNYEYSLAKKTSAQADLYRAKRGD